MDIVCISQDKDINNFIEKLNKIIRILTDNKEFSIQREYSYSFENGFVIFSKIDNIIKSIFIYEIIDNELIIKFVYFDKSISNYLEIIQKNIDFILSKNRDIDLIFWEVGWSKTILSTYYKVINIEKIGFKRVDKIVYHKKIEKKKEIVNNSLEIADYSEKYFDDFKKLFLDNPENELEAIWDEKFFLKRFDNFKNTDSIKLIFEDTKLIGYFILQNSALYMIAIDKRYRGKKKSILILEKICNLLYNKNIFDLILWVSDKNIPAIRAYTRIGMRFVFKLDFGYKIIK